MTAIWRATVKRLLVPSLTLATSGLCADAPAYDFFIVKTESLVKAAPTDEALRALKPESLMKVCVANGSFHGGTVSLDLRTAEGDRISVSFQPSGLPPSFRTEDGFDYWITIQKCRSETLHLQGSAVRLGPSYVTRNWRDQPFTTVLRFINLKR